MREIRSFGGTSSEREGRREECRISLELAGYKDEESWPWRGITRC